MSMTYLQAGEETHAMAREIFEKYHDPLLRAPDGEFVKLCIMFVIGEAGAESDGVLKHHGYPAIAIISIIPLKQRVDKRADCEIVIDQVRWRNLTEAQQRAVLDHEITHIELQKDDHGYVKIDDIGRPKIKLKLHDYEISGFREVARRHGEDSIEVIEAKAFQKQYGEDVLAKEQLFSSR